jgi:putative tryptophan/tyrosine transport system substrate-binding protein
MRRRQFITLFGGAAAAWPVVTWGQQPEQMRRVGALIGATADDPDAQTRTAAFVQALRQLGWTDGRNVRIDIRWGAGNAETTRKYAVELVALSPDVILAGGSSSVAPLLQATRAIPIVMAQAVDPVGLGTVKSMNRPGGNATGFTQFEYGLSAKWLELLREVAPQVTRVGVVRDRGPQSPSDNGR